MGGKQKQAQRTKNNARPSSSGRSAELLGSAIPPFMGFSGVKEGSYVPLLPSWSLSNNLQEDTDTIDGSFQIVLKKMSKKDATTKLKALQEFTAMISESKVDAVKTILPFWPRLYCHLATDVEHRVREAAQVAQGAVASKVKRNLAPHLKQLAPVWLIAQYDTYAPAASMATQSFQQAFPPNKLPEVMLFSQEEVLSYICDNLTVHTAQTLSNPKTTAPELAEAKYERILISSLLGYSFYLKTMSADQLKTPHEINKKIVTSSRFWKLVKHKTPTIRSSWYRVLSALCSYSPVLLEAEAGHLTCAVMANLDENDPAVLPAVWEAALLALATVKEWWTHVSVEKVVLPILWRVLKAGGQGCASSIYPHLLPLLAHFPPGQDPLQFYTCFFDNMIIGLGNKSVLTSRSELNAVSSAIIECMKYTILKNQCNNELCMSILSKQLLHIIKWTVTECHSYSKIVFKQIASLIHYWNRNSDKVDFPLYAVLVQTYWSELNNLIENLFENFNSEYDITIIEKTCDSILELLFSLRSERLSKTKSNLRVTFTESDTSLTNVDDSIMNSTQDIHQNKNLNTLVYSVLRLLTNQTDKVQNNQYIGHFCHLVQEFRSIELFQSLLTNQENSVLEFYREVLLKWLNNESICTKELVSICFVLFKYLNEDEKMFFLCSLTQVSVTSVMAWSVSCCLSHPLCDDLVVQEWLKKHDVSALLINITNKIIDNNELSDNMTILKQCFMHNEDILINEQTSADIINLICSSLEKESVTLDTCASFASQIATIIYSDSCRFNCNSTLVCGLFSLALRFKGCNEYFSADTLWEVNAAWQDAVNYIAKDKTNLLALANDCALIIKENLFSNEWLDETLMAVMSDSVINFVKNALENPDLDLEVDENKQLTCDLLDIFLNVSVNEIDQYRIKLTSLCLNADLINGQLSIFSEQESDEVEKYLLGGNHIYDDISLASKLFLQSYFTLTIIKKLLQQSNTENDNYDCENDNDHDDQDNTTHLHNDNPHVEKQIIELIYDAVLFENLSKNYKNTALWQEIFVLPFYSLYKENLINLIDILHIDTRYAIENKLHQAARAKALYWTHALYYFEKELKYSSNSPTSLSFDVEKLYKRVLCKENSDTTDLGWIHITQIFKNLPAECISVKFDGQNDSWIKFRWNQTVAARCMSESELRDDSDTRPFEIMHVLLNKNKLDSNTLLYNRNVGSSPWPSVMLVSELARLMASIISKSYGTLSEDQWDGIRLALSSWVLSIAKSRQEISQLKIKIFVSSIFELFTSIIHVTNLPEHEALKQEWNAVFSKEVNLILIKSWMVILDCIKNQTEYYINNIPFVQNLNKTMNCIDYGHVFNANKVDSKTSLNDLIELSLELLQTKNLEIQYSAQLVLKSLASYLVKKDDEALHNSPEECNNPLIFNKYEKLLKELDDLIKILLIDFKLCENSCAVKPNTDSYFITFSYLLLCDVILHHCEIANSSLRLQYASWLSSRDYIKTMLENVLRLMPHQILQCLELKMPLYQKMFSTIFDITDSAPVILEHLACYIYCNTLRLLPALARQWWNSSDSRVSNIVDKITTTYVSHLICKEEIEAVQNHQTKDEHMQVKVNAACEVLAIYTVDEVNMEILISLPYNYPLGPVKVMSRREICGTAQWRTWIRQLTLFLTHQNGNIWDGLTQWKNNLDKRFDGVEECYVCYSVVHASTHQLPKSTCKTCRKKFHSQCLYKWFNTSNKSTCPICRNMF